MAHDIYWYCCYGSNLSRDRFLCYIKGGTPRFGKTRGRGCDDKKFMDISRPFKIHHNLYFGLPKGRKATGNWGEGGVAFLDRGESSEHTTLCRLWKVTSEQFSQIMKQEGDWYNDLIKFGEVDGFPVFTFTRRKPGLNFQVHPTERPPDAVVMKPSVPYVKTIMLGLMETYPELGRKETLRYLEGLEGIRGNYEYVDFLELYQEFDEK